MQCWTNKVAVLTDSSNELAVSIMQKLTGANMTVIGFIDLKNNPDSAIENLKNIEGIHIYDCDITDTKQIKHIFNKITESYGGVDVLINNACYKIDSSICTGDLKEFKQILDVNIFAFVSCTNSAVESMLKRKSRGHIINIHELNPNQLQTECKQNVFVASKYSVTSINEILRHELRYLKANIKVTNVLPRSIEDDLDVNDGDAKLNANDLAELIMTILNTPEHLQVHEIYLDSTIM